MTDGEKIRNYANNIWNLLNPTRTEGIHVKFERGLGPNSAVYLVGSCSLPTRQKILAQANSIRAILTGYPETCEIASIRVVWGTDLIHPEPTWPIPPQWPPGTPPPIYIPAPPPQVPIAEGICWAIA